MLRIALFVATLGWAASPALAQPTARDTTVARQSFREGVRAAQAGEWETARERFAQAYELGQRPSALLNLAAAQSRTGRLVESAESYRVYLGLVGDDDDNRAAAEAQLAELTARIPTVRLRIRGVTEADQVTLDDEALNPRLLDAPIPVDPGQRRFVVVRDGTEVASAVLFVAEGEAREAALDAPSLDEPTAPEQAPEDRLARGDEPAPSESITPAAAAASTQSRGMRSLEEPTPSAEPESESVFATWWFWTLTGVVLLGVGLTIGIVVGTQPAEPPPNRGFPGEPLEIP